MSAPRDPVAEAILTVLVSPNESDSNLEAANVVDALFALARAVDRSGKRIEDALRALARSGEVAP
jgi:hypothetical protein